MDKTPETVHAALTAALDKAPSLTTWQALGWLILDAQHVGTFSSLLPWLRERLQPWPEALRTVPHADAGLCALATTLEVGLTAVRTSKKWLQAQRAAWADPRLAHITGLEITYLDQNAHLILPALAETFSGLTYLSLGFAPSSRPHLERHLQGMEVLLRRVGPTLRELVLGPPRQACLPLVQLVTRLADTGALPALRVLDLDAGWEHDAALAVLDSPGLSCLQFLTFRALHAPDTLIAPILARPASRSLLGLRLEQLQDEDILRLKTAEALRGVRYPEYHTETAPESWQWGTARAGIQTLLAGVDLDHDAGQQALATSPTLHISGDAEFRRLLATGDGDWRSLPQVVYLSVEGLSPELLGVLLAAGPTLFPALDGLELREFAEPAQVAALARAPMGAHLQRAAWLRPVLRGTPARAEDWVAQLRSDLPLRYRKRLYDDHKYDLSDMSVAQLRALARHLALKGSAGLGKAALVEQICRALPAEVRESEGMLASCSHTTYA